MNFVGGMSLQTLAQKLLKADYWENHFTVTIVVALSQACVIDMVCDFGLNQIWVPDELKTAVSRL